MTHSSHRNGYTLIEVLIYAALLGIALLSLTTMYLASLETRAVIVAQNMLLENRRLARTTILSRLEQAHLVLLPAAGTGSILSISSPVTLENPVTFSVSGGRLMMQLGAGVAAPITSPDVTVTNFSVERLTGTPASVSVSITYETVTGHDRPLSQTSTFTYTLRYE